MSNNNCYEIDENNENEEIILTSDEYNQILNIQQQILEMIAAHNQTSEILAKLCSLAESLLPNSVASIMIKNKETGLMSVKSAPSIPQNGQDRLANLKPGSHGGSCGNAVFKNRPQFVQNTFTDERWENLRQVAIDFNICSCWSMPVRDKVKHSIGSFALSSFEHRAPNLFHVKLLRTAASIVSIILKDEEMEKRNKLFSNAMKNSADGIVITDEKNQIIEVNNAVTNIYGYSKDEIIGKNPKMFASKEYSKNFYKKMWNDLNRDSKWSGEIVNKKKDGSLITQWISITALHDENNLAHNYLAMFTDLTPLKEAQNKMEFMAYHDSLTNLYNKSYLEIILNTQKDKTLILLNINNFSYINTAYGFDIGDEILINVSRTLEKHFEIDTLCKINSDEFALVFNERIPISEKIIEIQNYFMKNLINIEKIKLNITFSYGAVSGKNNLLRKAASALKEAKENGKNRFEIFEQNSNDDYLKREAFINYTNLIRNALDNNQVVPFFQGIYNNDNNCITKYEALARIVLEDRVVSPYEFLEPAKLSGLLPEITKVMIDKTMKTMSSNNHEFSINITEDDLAEEYLNEYLDEKIALYKIEPKRVILEILEGVSSTGKKNQIKQLTLLKKRGFKIAIDDFGAEYSNFERILDLDIDYIKIDAKYIKDIDTNKRSYEIVKAISFFARNVNIPCIAEFVHNESVQKFVKDLGINYSQGYYFSEPKKELLNK
ncbi:MAG: EAL domain-containing protein [Aliarcobacter sp.]|nr:EAL domain-containing protein [Aliarcobacter sp.]